MPETTCLFCKIVQGQIPAEKVYEDDVTLAFKDIGPKAPVHVLVIPKQHYESVHDVPAEQMGVMAALFSAVNTVVRQAGLLDGGYRLVINAGADAGQAVPHIHVHVLAGRKLAWPPG